jgi:fatty acid desaturase
MNVCCEEIFFFFFFFFFFFLVLVFAPLFLGSFDFEFVLHVLFASWLVALCFLRNKTPPVGKKNAPEDSELMRPLASQTRMPWQKKP